MFSIRGCYYAFGNVAVFSPSKGGGVRGKRGIFGISVSIEIAANTTLPLPNELLRCELQCSSCIIKKKISSCFSRSFTSIHASSLEDVLIYAVLVMKTVHGEISTKKTQRPTRIHIQYANSKYVKIQWYEYKMGVYVKNNRIFSVYRIGMFFKGRNE